MFAVLPFGLSTACYVFTKLLRPLVKCWRSLAKGLRVIVYIDDGICAAGSHSKCLEYKELAVSDLGKAGFVLNIPKLQLEPLRTGRWLGFILDLETGCGLGVYMHAYVYSNAWLSREQQCINIQPTKLFSPSNFSEGPPSLAECPVLITITPFVT